MADVNITKVYLLNVPLESDYKQTLYFTSPSDQYSYFYDRRVSGCSFTDFSYQRKDGIIRVPVHYDTLVTAGVNYVMYQNTAYKKTHSDGSDRWFYAFITDMVYKDDGRTDIYIQTDVIQTWMHDITVKPSFVEREHCNDDTIGLHTYPEMVETGEYVVNGHTADPALTGTSAFSPNYIVMSVSEYHDSQVEGIIDGIGGKPIHGIYSGAGYIAFPTGSYEKINDVIEKYAGNNSTTLDAISNIFIAPHFLIDYLSDDGTPGFGIIKNTSSPKTYENKIVYNKSLNGYGDKVKNNKLYTYPYNYLLVTNNNGGSAVYQYEHFDYSEDEYAHFEVSGVLCPGCSVRMVPLDYKGASKNDDEGLNLGKYPICNWAGDAFTNWMTQNSVNVAASFGSGIASLAVGGALLATGAGAIMGASAIAGGVTSILGTIGEVKKQSMQPPQLQGNINCGDVVTAGKRNSFHFYNMSIKKEYAQIIDNYFTMYGYKTCLVKTPNKNHRPHFWYTKTIDVNIDGKIPNKDMQVIKNCYNNGITFWKNDGTFGDYSVDNSI